MTWTIAALYRFTSIPDGAGLRLQLLPVFEDLGLCGSLLIAPEGINGTLAGTASAVDTALARLLNRVGLPRDDVKFSTSETKPFGRLKLRLKREIITFDQPAADPTSLAGIYVEPAAWNALLEDPETLLLDTRNRYETGIGMFESARDPGIDHFTEFADFVRSELDPARHKKIAMYCTGGIRCEKASAFMRTEGFEEVYHLKGGILKYLETIPADESKWQGECYVFDKRVAVAHALVEGTHDMCDACGYPVRDDRNFHAAECPKSGTKNI